MVGTLANYKQVNLTSNCKVLRGFERLSVSEKQVGCKLVASWLQGYEGSKRMSDLCTDNRIEVITKAKAALLESTNIESSPEEMSVLNDFLFRCWQMGWLDAYYFMELVRCLGIRFVVEGDIIKVKWRRSDKHYIVPFGGLLELWEKYKEQDHE